MERISRPFQVALAAVALLALVWVVALHRPSSGSSGAKSSAQPTAAASTPTKTSAPHGSSSAAGKTGGTGAGAYHGSAPGVAGLTHALAKAHGAVATSQQNAKQLQEKSEQASGASAAQSSTAAPSSSAGTSTAPTRTATTTTPAATAPAKPKVAPHHAVRVPGLANQHLVEAELKHGKVVALLFWSSKGSDDVAVRGALRKLAGSDHRLAVHVNAAKQVASFGSITRGVQVFGTPTILIVGKHGRTIVLTGLQDAYAIQQAVNDARHA
jgi:hypothetical protein